MKGFKNWWNSTKDLKIYMTSSKLDQLTEVKANLINPSDKGKYKEEIKLIPKKVDLNL